MPIVEDAHGVNSAIWLRKHDYNIISKHRIKDVLTTVIARYDKTPDSAELVTTASDILDTMNNGGFVFQMNDLKKMCEYLLNNQEPSKVIDTPEEVNIHNSQ